MICLVTGATGFVGRALCERLSASGVEYKATSRGGGTSANYQPVQALDLESNAVGPEMLDGVDVVFHLAGIAHQDAAVSTYESTNYRATLELAAAAAAAGVKRFVFLSSVKAMGPPGTLGLRSEDQCVATDDPYGHFKRQAELELCELSENTGMSVIVLRPALVYGTRVAGNLRLLATAARVGIPRPPDVGGRSMIAVDDLTALLVKLIQDPLEGFHLWIVCDGHSYSASKIYALMQTALGKTPSNSWLPLWVWRCTCALRDIAGGNSQGTTYGKVFGSETYSNAKLLAELNWCPEVTLEDCVEQMMNETSGT